MGLTLLCAVTKYTDLQKNYHANRNAAGERRSKLEWIASLIRGDDRLVQARRVAFPDAMSLIEKMLREDANDRPTAQDLLADVVTFLEAKLVKLKLDHGTYAPYRAHVWAM